MLAMGEGPVSAWVGGGPGPFSRRVLDSLLVNAYIDAGLRGQVEVLTGGESPRVHCRRGGQSRWNSGADGESPEGRRP